MDPSIPDFCPSCDAADNPFALTQRETEQDFRGETFRVTSPALQCHHCGFGILGPGHLDALRIATHDAYRRKYGLPIQLTSRSLHGEFILPGVSFTDVKPTIEQRADRGASSDLGAILAAAPDVPSVPGD